MELNLPRIQEVAMVVKDLDKSVNFYSKVFGWGPFTIFESDQSRMCKGKPAIYKGKPASGRLRVALTPWDSGPCIELIQPLDGHNLFADFLEQNGEGLHHLHCGIVDDLDVVLAEFAKDGIEILTYGEMPQHGCRTAFVVGEKTNGLIVELTDMRCKKVATA